MTANSDKPRYRPVRFARFWLGELGIALILGVLVSVVWVINFGMWSATDWQTPASYGGDGLQILGWIRAAMEGDYHFFGMSFIERLGAPFEANWNDYPMYEKPFTILLGHVARLIGVMAAANLGMLLVHVAATMSFYLTCRGFRWCRWWSAIGALVFGMQAYISLRGQDHLLLALVYTLPPAVSVIWRLYGSRRLGPATPGRRWCVAVSFLMGVSGPYYLNMYLQLLLLTLGLHGMVRPHRTNLVTGGQSLLAAIAGFLLAHNGMLTLRLLAGTNAAALTRTTSEAEIYALRPVELFLPSPLHRWDAFAAIGRYYKTESAYLQPESLSGYLGVIGGIALLALIMTGVRRLTANRAHTTHLAFWLSGWVLVYSVVGGVNSALALLGIRMFRASNRYSVFVATMVLLWLVGRLHLSRSRWPRSWQLGLGISMTCFAALDQLPRNTRPDVSGSISRQLQADAEFGDLLESTLPPASRVFQLPAAKFPEGRPVQDMPAYDQLRPYLHTSTARFSFGGNRGRMDAAWPFNLERMPPREMLTALHRYGFRAVVLHRHGLTDRGDRLLAILQQLGLQPMAVAEEDDFVLVPLPPPVDGPDQPDLATLPFLDHGTGWTRRDVSADETLWIAPGYSQLKLNPNFSPGEKLELEIDLAAIEPVTVAGRIAGELLFTQRLDAGESRNVSTIFAHPGIGRDLILTSINESADTRPGPDFAVKRLSLKRISPP